MPQLIWFMYNFLRLCSLGVIILLAVLLFFKPNKLIKINSSKLALKCILMYYFCASKLKMFSSIRFRLMGAWLLLKITRKFLVVDTCMTRKRIARSIALKFSYLYIYRYMLGPPNVGTTPYQPDACVRSLLRCI